MTLFKAFLVAASIASSQGAPTESLAGRRVSHLVPIHAVPSLHAVPSVRTVQLSPIQTVQQTVEDIDLNPQYKFGYTISDSETGDAKSREESRDGDVVTGSYSVLLSDGRLQTVTYSADDEHGFTAKVTYDGEEGPPAIPFNSPTNVAVSPTNVAVANPVDNVVIAAKTVENVPAVKSVSQDDNGVRDPELASTKVASSVPQVQASSVPASAIRTLPTSSRTIPTSSFFQHSPLSVVRTVPSSHLFHNTASPLSVVRTVPSSHVLQSSSSPVSVVSSVPSSTFLHSSSSPVSLVRTVPSSHVLHSSSSPVSVVRTVPSSHVVHSSSSPVSFLRSVPSSLFPDRSVPSSLFQDSRSGAVVSSRDVGPVFGRLANNDLQFPVVHSSSPQPIDLSQFRFVSAAQVLPTY